MTKALFILTSTGSFPDHAGDAAGRDTGYYIDELAAPWAALRDAGAQIEFASIKGGNPPLDPASLPEDEDTRPEAVKRLLADDDAMAKLGASQPVKDIDPTVFDVVFLPGGHGTMFDFGQSADLAGLLGTAWDNGAVIGAVCHGPAGLLNARDRDGTPIIRGRKVNGFSNSEEEASGLTDAVPYLLADALREQGGHYESGDDFTSYALRDGRLVTGQNPQSAEAVAKLLIEALEDRGAADDKAA